MEEYTLTELETTLDEFLKALCDKWKELLKRDNKKASGDLIRSIQPLELRKSASRLEGSIKARDYWKYVEYGRRPGKFPPVNKIEKWIKIKPVKPMPDKFGRTPSIKQLAFLIARSIATNGIKPGKQFNEAFEWTWRLYEKRIEDAIQKDMDRNLALILSDFL